MSEDRFENIIRKNLEKLEIDPSEKLWPKIENGIVDGKFENQIKNKFDSYSETPNSSNWQKIQSELGVPLFYNKQKLLWLIAIFLLFPISLVTILKHDEIRLKSIAIDALKSVKNEQPIKKAVKSFSADKPIKLPDEPKKVFRKIPQKVTAPVQFGKPEIKAIVEGDIKTQTNINTISENTISANFNINEIQPNAVVPIRTDSIKSEEVPVKRIDTSAVISEVKNTISGNYSYSNEELGKFGITSYVGLNMGFMELRSPKNSVYDLSGNIELRNKVEVPKVDWTGGISFDYYPSKRLILSLGIRFSNLRQKLNYGISGPAINPLKIEAGAIYINQNDSIISGENFGYDIIYSYTEIPLSCTLKLFGTSKTSLELKTGISYAFINNVNSYIINNSNVGVLVLYDKSSFPGVRNLIFVNLSPAVSYKYSESVSLGAALSISKSTNSMIENKNWVQQYPSLVGVNIFLRKRF